MTRISHSPSPLATGARGLQEGLSAAARHAEEIVASSANGEISVEGFLGLQASARQVKASAAVIRVGDDLQERVLDIIA